MVMVSRLVNFGYMFLLIVSFGCQSSNLYDPDADLGTNTVNGQAQRTSGFPNHLRPSEATAKKAGVLRSEGGPVDGVAAQALKPAVTKKAESSAFSGM